MKTKSQSKITLALLLVLSMVLGSAILAFAAPDVPTAWNGSVADSFESGVGSESDPFVIKTPAQLALMRKLVNAGAEYYVDVDGNVVNAAKVIDAMWFMPQGTEGNAAKSFAIFEYEGATYFYNGNTGVAQKVASYDAADYTTYIIHNKPYYASATPKAGDTTGVPVYSYDVDNFAFATNCNLINVENGNRYYTLTDGSYNSADGSTYVNKNASSGKLFYETVYTINLADGSTVNFATSSLTHRMVNTEVSSVAVDGQVGYLVNTVASGECFAYTYEALANGSISVTKGAELALDLKQYNSASYRLDADIALNDISNVANWAAAAPANIWAAIGASKTAPFSGHFDGNGHTVYGLYDYQQSGANKNENFFIDSGERYNTKSTANPYHGLFGYVKNATLENVILSDGYMDIRALGGALVAAAEDSVISDVTNLSVNIDSRKTQFDVHIVYNAEAGGIVANLKGNSIVRNCQNYANMYAENTSGSSGGGTLDAYMGGIVARVNNSEAANTYIYNCVNYGDISGKTQFTSKDCPAGAGGIAGEVRYGRVASCFNFGDISGWNPGGSGYVGGIAGHLYSGEITSCVDMSESIHAYPTTIGSGTRATGAGGIVGVVQSVNNKNYSYVRNCVVASASVKQDANASYAENTRGGLIAGYINQYVVIQNNYYIVPSAGTQTEIGSQNKNNTIANNYAITADHLKGTSSAIIGADSEYANTANLVLALDRYILADNKSYTYTFDQGENGPVAYREYLQRTALNVTGTEFGSYSAMASADNVFPASTGLVAEGAVVGETYRFGVTPNDGYVLRNVELTVGSNAPVVLAPDAEGGYSFVLPAESVVVALNFVPAGAGAYPITYEGIDEVLSWSAYRPGAHFEGYTTAIPVPTRSGYLFAGWVVNGQGAAVMDLVLGANDYSAPITLTATWNAKKVVDIAYEQQIPVYNGQAHAFAIIGADAALAGLKVEYFVDGAWTENAPSLAGKYDVRLTRAEDGEYQKLDRVLSEGLFIDRAASSVTIIGNLDKIYNGEALVNPEVTTVGDGEVSYHWYQGDAELLAAPVNAGAYKLVVRISQGANYKAAEAELAVVVSRATIPADSFSWNYTEPFEYNGAAQSVAIVGLPSHVVVTYTNASAENAGEYTASAVLTVDETNYNPISIAPITWKINKATIDASDMHWNYDGVYYYNATTHSVAIVGVPANVEVNYEGTVSAKDVGVYSVSATFVFDSANYNPISIEPLTWEVKKATLASLGLSWSVADFTYDGTVKSVTVVGLPADITVSAYAGNEGINAGSYTATATFVYDSNNYEEVSIAPLTWEIKKATYDMSEVKWSENLAFTYDGANKSVTVSGMPAGVTVSYTDNEKVNAGSYKAVASFVGNPNYNDIPSMEIEWSIAKANAVISAEEEYTFFYNGSPIVIPANLNHNEIAITTNPAEIIDKGEYTVELIAAATVNYNEARATVKVIVVESDASILNRISIMIDKGIHTPSQVQRLALLQQAYATLNEVQDLSSAAAREVLDNFGYLVYVYNDYANQVNATMEQAEECALVLTDRFVYSPSVVAMLSDIKKKKWLD